MLSLAVLLARAGGGQNFGGGGGGGVGGGGIGGGGGGGFFFFGGNGGGGGSIGVVVFLVLAVLLFVGVVAVRGARGRGRIVSDDSIAGTAADGSVPGGPTGLGGGPGAPAAPGGSGLLTEKQVESWGRPSIPDLGFRGDYLPGSSVPSGAQPAQTGLDAIRSHDPAFDEANFLAEVQRAFFVVEQAWTELKPEMSRRVMADGLWQQHRVQIEQYVNEHKRNVLEDLSVGNATVVSTHSDESFDTIVVRFLAACADYDVNTDNHKVVRGNKRVGQWQEDWTFQRASDATTKTGGGTFSEKCPNCGAPLDVDLQGVCHFCKAPVMSGKYDWVLTRISQLG